MVGNYIVINLCVPISMEYIQSCSVAPELTVLILQTVQCTVFMCKCCMFLYYVFMNVGACVWVRVHKHM